VAFVCAESGAFDVSALLSARLDTTASAAWTVILSMFLIAECVCGGMSIATCAVVGSALGSGKPKRAKRLAVSAILLVAVWATVDALLLYWFHESIFNFFTQDPNVHAALAEIVWIILPLHISDSIQFVFQGIFSGCGQNHLGAIALVLSLWVMGIGGILYFLHFTKLGLIGVPLGLTIGLASACPVLCFLVFKRFDWTALAKEAMKEHMEDEEMLDLFPMTPASPVPGQQSPASFVGSMVQFSP
jgi:MATE family multidrug resistance protein